MKIPKTDIYDCVKSHLKKTKKNHPSTTALSLSPSLSGQSTVFITLSAALPMAQGSSSRRSVVQDDFVLHKVKSGRTSLLPRMASERRQTTDNDTFCYDAI